MLGGHRAALARFFSALGRTRRSGEPGAAPAARGAARAEPDGGASGRLLGESRVPEGRSAAASPSPSRRPRNVRLFTPSPKEAEESPVQPAGAEVRPLPESQGSPARPPDTSSQKMVRGAGGGGGGARGGRPPARRVAVYRGGGAGAGASSGGEASGRGVADGEGTRGYTSGRRPGPGAGVPRGLRACAGSSVNDYRTPGVWTR